MKIMFLVVCLIAICVEFQETLACLHKQTPCKHAKHCYNEEDCNGGTCNTGKVIIKSHILSEVSRSSY